jgi:hypothetical protein
MKRLLFLVLMTFCSLSWAEWQVAVDTDAATFYFNKETIKKNGNLVKMWTKANLKSAANTSDGKPYIRLDSLFLFDCKEETAGLTSQTFYSNYEGSEVQAMVNIKQSELEMNPFSPGSVFGLLWKTACGKK